MKLALNTLGAGDWTLDTIIGQARRHGCAGVDFRGYAGTLDLFKLPEFTTRADETAARLRDAGLAVSCFSTSARVAADPAGARAEIEAYLPLCVRFGARQLRVFGGEHPGVARETARARAIETLRALGDRARDADATILFETHDAWTASADVADLLRAVDHPAVAALWDTHHPWRLRGETPTATWAALGPWVRNTHWKDSMPGTPRHRLCQIGAGDVPFGEFLDVLRAGGYDGWLTLEWERRWHPDLPPMETALERFAALLRQKGVLTADG